MPSLRKRVSTYLRQLSFHNEPRNSDRRHQHRNINENTFITKYLLGQIKLKEAPPIVYGKTPQELPNYELDQYDIGPNTIIGCYTGPKGGLTTVKRLEKHLSIPDQDIDFIDTGNIQDDDDDNNSDKNKQQNDGQLNHTTSNNNENQIEIDDSLLPNEWLKKSDFIYGLSDSLYDRNQITNNKNGDPIADCFGIISRDDSAILAVADGVNWGEKASIAAKSAIHGCVHYLNKTIFNDTKPFDKLTTTTKTNDCNNIDDNDDQDAIYNNGTANFQRITNTKEIFICLLRAFNCAHDLILENDGMLTTLTVVVVLPLKRKIKQHSDNSTTTFQNNKQFICCVCNVGDTLAYVYSQKYGIRELTKGSHDINCVRDMRDALGALGPVDGINPELSNLTLSLTTLQLGDIVMVASDGLTDNFDPNVCRFTSNQPCNTTSDNKENRATTRQPPPKQQQQQSKKAPIKPPRRSQPPPPQSQQTKPTSGSVSNESNPLIEHFIKQNSIDKKPNLVGNSASGSSSLRRQISSQSYTSESPSGSSSNYKKPPPPPPQGYKFLRSKTTIDNTTRPSLAKQQLIQRNADGLPLITPIQRYELQLLLMEDILMHGINGNELPCKSAKQLCEYLMNFTFSITAAKRHTLEDPDLYYNNRNGLLMELTQQEKKQRRKKCLEKIQNLPGKLDHVSVVGWNVGNLAK